MAACSLVAGLGSEYTTSDGDAADGSSTSEAGVKDAGGDATVHADGGDSGAVDGAVIDAALPPIDCGASGSIDLTFTAGMVGDARDFFRGYGVVVDGDGIWVGGSSSALGSPAVLHLGPDGEYLGVDASSGSLGLNGRNVYARSNGIDAFVGGTALPEGGTAYGLANDPTGAWAFVPLPGFESSSVSAVPEEPGAFLATGFTASQTLGAFHLSAADGGFTPLKWQAGAPFIAATLAATEVAGNVIVVANAQLQSSGSELDVLDFLSDGGVFQMSQDGGSGTLLDILPLVASRRALVLVHVSVPPAVPAELVVLEEVDVDNGTVSSGPSISLPGPRQVANAVLAPTNDRLLVLSSATETGVVLTRAWLDGGLDPSFGEAGSAVAIPSTSMYINATALTIDAYGRILVLSGDGSGHQYLARVCP